MAGARQCSRHEVSAAFSCVDLTRSFSDIQTRSIEISFWSRPFPRARYFCYAVGRGGDGFQGGAEDEIRIVKPWVLAAVVAFLVVGPCDLSAQEAATALSSVQQSAAKSALCSAIASKFPNPAAAGPSALSDPGGPSTAASSFVLPFENACDHLTAASMRVFIRERKSAPICHCRGDRETVFSAGAGPDCEDDACRPAISAFAAEFAPNASTLRASGRLALTGASAAAHAAVFSEALFRRAGCCHAWRAGRNASFERRDSSVDRIGVSARSSKIVWPSQILT